MASRGGNHGEGRRGKRAKVTAGRGQSSSAAPPPAPPMPHHLRFRPNHMQFWDAHYSNRTIIQEKALLLDKIDPAFADTIRTLGWEALTVIPPLLLNETLVREFFSNLRLEDLARGFVWVRGVNVPFSADVINRSYNLPTHYERDYDTVIAEYEAEGNDVIGQLKNWLCPDAPWTLTTKGKPKSLKNTLIQEDGRVQLRFIWNRIMPKDAPSKAGVDELILLAAMNLGLPIDVGTILYRMIEQHLTDRKRCIIIPSLICQLCREADVPEYDEDIETKQPAPMKREKPRTTAPPAAYPPVPPTSQPGSSSSAAPWISDVERRAMSMNDSMRSFMRDQQATQGNILTGLWLQSRGAQAVDESIYNPSPLSYRFTDEIEQMMDRIRLEAVAGSDDDEE